MTDTIRDEAGYLADCGLHVIQLRGKIPMLKGWPTSKPPEREDIEAQWPEQGYNIGIVTGPAVVVVDADSAEDVAFCDEHLTRTPLKVRTSKGCHYYFRGNSEQRKAGRRGKVEVQGVGQQVVAPPSIHPDSGRAYEWEMADGFDLSDLSDLPELTRDDIAKIEAHAIGVESEGLGDFWSGGIDLSGVPDPVSAEDKPEPGSRNNTLAALAGRWRKDEPDPFKVEARALAWNDALPEPLPRSEVLKTVHSVYRTAATREQERGEWKLPDASASGELDRRVWLTWGELEDDNDEMPVELWQDEDRPTDVGFFFEGCRMLLAGAPKSKKSLFFLALAAAAATGSEFLGRKFVRPIRVAWIQAEIAKPFLRRRMKKVLSGYTDPAERALLRKNLVVTPRLTHRIDLVRSVNVVSEMIKEMGAEVVCFDPLVNFTSGDENKTTDMNELMAAVNHIQGDTRTTMVVIHHTRKSGGDGTKVNQGGDLFDNVRGSSVLRGWYDTGIVLTPDQIGFETRNTAAPAGFQIGWDDDAGTFTRPGAAIEAVVDGTPRDVLSACLARLRERFAAGEVFGVRAFLDAVKGVEGVSWRNRDAVLTELAGQGSVHYKPPGEKGRPAEICIT